MRLFVLLFFISVGCFSQSITGKVVGVMDGDTFKFLPPDSTLINVRLANIDCPEKKQPFSAKATAFTSQAVFGKTVTIHVQSKDRYGRYISNVIYGDSLSLCHELVKNGLAWHYVKFSKDKTLRQMERKARTAKLGLWQDPDPIAPWEWRSSKSKTATGQTASKPTSNNLNLTRCTGKTKAGARCKRMTKRVTGRCFQH